MLTYNSLELSRVVCHPECLVLTSRAPVRRIILSSEYVHVDEELLSSVSILKSGFEPVDHLISILMLLVLILDGELKGVESNEGNLLHSHSVVATLVEGLVDLSLVVVFVVQRLVSEELFVSETEEVLFVLGSDRVSIMEFVVIIAESGEKIRVREMRSHELLEQRVVDLLQDLIMLCCLLRIIVCLHCYSMSSEVTRHHDVIHIRVVFLQFLKDGSHQCRRHIATVSAKLSSLSLRLLEKHWSKWIGASAIPIFGLLN